MYICLEGIDGSGKTTQIKLLETWIKKCGIDVLRVFEPTDNEVGKLIRKLLQNPDAINENFQITLALLFAADRTVLMRDITEAEALAKIVISDRSFYSSMVYQNDSEWIAEINKHAKQPDLVILLDINPETAVSRCDGMDSFEEQNFLASTANKYLKLADHQNFMVVNANNGIKKVHDDIKMIVAHKLGMCI
ncbi:MAG: dTMP kinase [Methanobacterium sp. ERen5]|nr:MAG: dTMP kinase [Methanobacterium sp. ERen5]